ncbi:MAG: flagellin [Clostridium sp.]
MRLNINVASLNVYQNYKKQIGLQSSALEKISSGNKINSAKDNPNGLGKSETLRMQIRGLQSAQRNLQDSASMVQTFDSALDSVGNNLVRIRELTVQAGNETLTDADRQVIQQEIEQLKSSIDFTANNTEFNGVNLIGNEHVYSNDNPLREKTTVGPNVGESMDIPVFNVTTSILGDKDGNKVKDIDITNTENIDKSLSALDAAIIDVNRCRSKYGAIQSRMESTAECMDSNVENTTKAYSSVKDADLAKELINHSQATILLEASMAMLAQTNRLPSEALSILERVK